MFESNISENNTSINNTTCYDTHIKYNTNFNSDSSGVLRQYINPAVYVESSTDLNYYNRNDAIKNPKIKRCVCLVNADACPCHPPQICDNENGKTISSHSLKSQVSLKTKSSYCSSTFNESGSTITVKETAHDDLKLSILSLAASTVFTFQCPEDQDKEEAFKKWLTKKNEEKRMVQEEREHLRELKEKERQEHLERERQNFMRWLASKKKEEEHRRKEQEKQQEMEKEKQELKEQRSLECELQYQLWLKRKEEKELEKKILEQVDALKNAENKQKRLEESAKAYEDWLERSKYKPRPLPLNQGLDSLRSSMSVTYVNPTPWNGIAERQPKPASQ